MDIIFKHEVSQNMYREFFSVHTHPFCEIFFMMNGNGSYVVEGHEYAIYPNSMIILRPGEMHRAEIAPGCDYERCYLHFTEETVLELDPEGKLLAPFNDRLIGEKNFYGQQIMNTSFMKEILLSAEKMIAGNPGESNKLYHYLFVILKEIYNSFKSEKFTGDTDENNYDKLMYEIIQYINQNICDDQSVSDIEKKFFISRPVLNKRFKRATGTTVWDYIITKRVVLADRLISAGESPTQAAFVCGYNDYSAFYRAYRKVFNRSPRKSFESKNEK